jgi:polysaccharide export outer membrane protein
MNNRTLLQIVAAILFFLVSSCTSYKNISYFNDFEDSVNLATINTAVFKSPVIQPDDLIAITIQTLEPDVNQLLNIPNSSNTAETSVTTTSSFATPVYLVDKNGEIELPFTGKIKVQGYTTVEAKEEIRKEMIKYVKEPIINIKFANFKVIVMGEVTRPNTYVMPTEQVTIFDALSKAGDLTPYGKRENVILVRDNRSNGKTMVHLNLNSKDIFSSPWYYLQSNDIVYVEPTKAKAVNSDAATTRNITIGLSALSVIVTLVNFLTR